MNIFSEILKILLRFTLPILVIILILTLINIFLNYKKYGTKIFSSFKKYDLNGKMKELVIDILKRENRKQTLIVNRDDNSFYAITNYDVFAILILDYSYSISGSIDDEYLKINNKEMLNPIPKFLSDNKKIADKEINLKTIYINTKKDIKINITGIEKELCTLKEFSYQLYPNQHSTVKYDIEKMNKIYEEIEDIINGNN